MVKEKPNSTRQYDAEGFRRRAACICVKNEQENEVQKARPLRSHRSETPSPSHTTVAAHSGVLSSECSSHDHSYSLPVSPSKAKGKYSSAISSLECCRGKKQNQVHAIEERLKRKNIKVNSLQELLDTLKEGGRAYDSGEWRYALKEMGFFKEQSSPQQETEGLVSLYPQKIQCVPPGRRTFEVYY